LSDNQITVSDQEIRDASILIVDDLEVNVALLERMLGGEGYHNIRSLTDSQLVDETYIGWRPSPNNRNYRRRRKSCASTRA
jgi:hypothetical protein